MNCKPRKAQGGGELGSVGGTPRRVFNALLACGKMAEGPRRTGDTKKFSPCYVEIKSDTDEKLGSFIKFALGKKYPVALAVSAPANHWVYAVSATDKSIDVVDQQVRCRCRCRCRGLYMYSCTRS